jgi:hypothetical protein
MKIQFESFKDFLHNNYNIKLNNEELIFIKIVIFHYNINKYETYKRYDLEHYMFSDKSIKNGILFEDALKSYIEYMILKTVKEIKTKPINFKKDIPELNEKLISVANQMKEEHKMAEYNKEENFKKELEQLINKYSQEGGSNTPDFILAHYMSKCLQNFNEITKERDKWYGRTDHVVNTNITLEAPRND